MVPRFYTKKISSHYEQNEGVTAIFPNFDFILNRKRKAVFLENLSTLYGETLCWSLGPLVLWKFIGALDLWKCIDSNSPYIFEDCLQRIDSIWRDFMLEFWSTGPLEVYWSTGPWKCIDFNSLVVFLKTVFVENRLYMERLYVGISEHWSFGSVSEHWTFGSVQILIVLLYFEDYLCSLLWFSPCDLSMCIGLWI